MVRMILKLFTMFIWKLKSWILKNIYFELKNNLLSGDVGNLELV